MWTCPICSQSSTECLDIDPRLRSIQVCDQLTQHEIDWMKKAANISGAYLTAPLSFSFQQSPEPIIEHNEASQSSRPSFSMTSKSEVKQSVPSESSQTGNIPATVCKSSKRLIQKSLTDWTLSSKSNRKSTNSMQAPLQTENTINQLPTENEMTKDESPPKRGNFFNLHHLFTPDLNNIFYIIAFGYLLLSMSFGFVCHNQLPFS